MRKLLLSLTLCIGSYLNAQTIEKFSIDSGGGSYSGSLQIVYTIGELNVQEVSVSNITISEGFINPLGSGSLSVSSFLINDLMVYPNPTSKYLNIATKEDISKIDIFDLNGRIMMVENAKKQIDISYLSTGIYLIKIYSEKRQETKRFIKK